MATTLQVFEAGALNAIAAAIEANPALIESGVTTLEADIQAGLVNLAKNLPAVKGIAGMIVGPLEQAAISSLEAYVASFIATHPPAEVQALVVAWIQQLAKNVGG